MTTTTKCFKCDQCEKSYNRQAKLDVHRRTHTGEKPYICDRPGCEQAYARKAHLKRHVEFAHLDRVLQCDYPRCDKKFSTEYQLKRHKKTHLNPLPYICSYPQCQEKFRKNSKLQRHIAVDHLQEKPHKCTYETEENGEIKQCGKSFDYPSQLKKHIDYVHMNIQSYICSQPDCTEGFHYLRDLRKHQKICHIEETISCEICFKSGFKCQKDLERHLVIHNSSRELFCCEYPGCNSSYTQKKNLYKHVRVVHEKSEKFTCSKCGKSFGYRHNWKKHESKCEVERSTHTQEESIAMVSSVENTINYLLESTVGKRHHPEDKEEEFSTTPVTIEDLPLKRQKLQLSIEELVGL